MFLSKMLAFGHTPLWPMIIVLKNTIGQSRRKHIRGLFRYGALPARAIVPIISQCTEELIDFNLVKLCSTLSCKIYGPEFNRFFDESASYVVRLMGMLATYMPAPHLKYSRQMTKWECERVLELVDIADAEYLASNMKGTRAYQPGWALLVRRNLGCFFLVIRGTVNKGDLVLNLDAISAELETGITLHSGMQKAAVWVAENVHPILQSYKKNHAAKSYKLIITGHSLGAGVAMALGHHLISTHPEIYNSNNLKALGFGCPAMAGLSFANGARPWATNYVYDFDIISRLSLHSIKAFLKRLEILAEDKERGKKITTRELSRNVYADTDLYVPGKIILLQAVHMKDGRCVLPQADKELSVVEESEYAQTVCTTYEHAGETNKRIMASEISPHDLGEFLPDEVGLVDHGFYGYLFNQAIPITMHIPSGLSP